MRGEHRLVYNPSRTVLHIIMKTVNKSVLIWYRPEEMYALVTDVASLPEFLPWCDQRAVLDEDDARHDRRGRHCFRRRAPDLHHAQHPCRGTARSSMQLVDGPFSRLDGQWLFVPLGDAGARVPCRFDLKLWLRQHGAGQNSWVRCSTGLPGSLVDAFVKRAEQVYGLPESMVLVRDASGCWRRAPRQVQRGRARTARRLVLRSLDAVQASGLLVRFADPPARPISDHWYCAVWGRKAAASPQVLR